MKKFVYPAVIFYDIESESYVASIEDLHIYTEGDSVEEAHKRAGAFLENYLEFAIENDVDITPPTDFDTIAKENSMNIVVLVDCVLSDDGKKINK